MAKKYKIVKTQVGDRGIWYYAIKRKVWFFYVDVHTAPFFRTEEEAKEYIDVLNLK